MMRMLCVVAALGYSAGAALVVKEKGTAEVIGPVGVLLFICLLWLRGIWFLSRPARWFFPFAVLLQAAFTMVGAQVGVPEAMPISLVGFFAALALQVLLFTPSTKKLFYPPERDPDAPVL